MKNKFYLTSIIFISLFSFSCNKFLETVPKDTLTVTNYYETEDQINSALAAVYETFVPIYGSGFQGVMSLDADEGFYNRSKQTTGISVNLVTTSETNVTGVWTALYSGVERANILLANLDKGAISEEAKATVRGEALFLRSYFYFLLASYWGSVPLLLEPTSSVAKTDNPRTPLNEIYEQIIKDMTEAETLVNSAQDVSNAGRVNKSAVRGILARVCLNMAGEPLNDHSKYELAKFWAKKVVDDGFHQLNPDFKQVFINMCQDKYDLKESIWEVEFYGYASDPYKAVGRVGVYNGIAHEGYDPNYGYCYGYVAVTPKLYFSYERGDLRRDWTIAPYTLSKTNPAVKTYLPAFPTAAEATNRNSAKWRREFEQVFPKEQNGGPTNFPLLRYSDVLLMYAEADAGMKTSVPTQDVLDLTINQVRRRAFGKFFPQKELLDTIVIENPGSGYTSAPPVYISGGGGTDALVTSAIITTGTKSLRSIFVNVPGQGFTAPPVVTIGDVWVANTSYAKGKQIHYNGKLYTVTTAGTTTTTPPTHTSGASTAAATGAVFTYAGVQATAKAIITDLSNLDVDIRSSDFHNYDEFMDMLKAERSRELAFETLRKRDLVRWGDYVPVMKQIALDFEPLGGRSFGGRAGQNTSERDVLWPIPDAETIVNKAIGQNPGW